MGMRALTVVVTLAVVAMLGYLIAHPHVSHVWYVHKQSAHVGDPDMIDGEAYDQRDTCERSARDSERQQDESNERLVKSMLANGIDQKTALSAAVALGRDRLVFSCASSNEFRWGW